MDPEKASELEEPIALARARSSVSDNLPDLARLAKPGFKTRLSQWNARIEGLAGLERRGIKRVLPEDKHSLGCKGYLQMFTLWFGMNLVASNLVTGLLGPLVFNLGWTDCVCCVIFANALSSCGASYTSTFGPQSGNRTMVRERPSHSPGLLSIARSKLIERLCISTDS